MDVQGFMIGVGLMILVTAVVWPILSRIAFERVSGDMMFQRRGTTFYFPLATSIMISTVLTALFWLFSR